MLNVLTNTTETLAGPSTKDAGATYFAGLTSLVQLDSKGDVSYLPYNQNDTSANAAAQWSKVVPLANAAPPTSTTPGATSTSGSAPKQSGTSKSSNSSSSDSQASSNGAVAVAAPGGLLSGLLSGAVLGCVAVLF